MLRFDVEKEQWITVKEMSTARCFSAHTVLSGSLLVIGGMDEQDRFLNSVEHYVPLTDKWEPVAPMRHGRADALACALNGFVYVNGGRGTVRNTGFLFQSIDRYNLRENSWTWVIY